MGKIKKRTRVTAPKTAPDGITIQQVERKGGTAGHYLTHKVQGWYEDGKWQRRFFKERDEAERFAALKRVEMENQGREQRMVLSCLTEEQHEHARQAFDTLGDAYDLGEVVAFFLKHHRPPDFTIRFGDAVDLYLADKESDGLRPRTLQGYRSTLERFRDVIGNPHVHEVTTQQVEGFLKGTKSRNDEHAKASLRTWQLHRGDIERFFQWCAQPDPTNNRPYTFENPVSRVRKVSARLVREEMAETPATTSPERLERILSVLMRWRDGRMVKPYALLYFAGIRPAELERMEGRDDLINLKTGIISIPAGVSKTRDSRQVVISKNLAAWLEAYPGETVPANFTRYNKQVRKHFAISRDEPRHSFISFHVALNRSVGDAALQAGNSETIVKRHYLNTHTQEEGRDFFAITPVPDSRGAVIEEVSAEQMPTVPLRAVG